MLFNFVYGLLYIPDNVLPINVHTCKCVVLKSSVKMLGLL